MEEVFIMMAVAAVVVLQICLPLGMLIWLFVLSRRLKKQTAELAALRSLLSGTGANALNNLNQQAARVDAAAAGQPLGYAAASSAAALPVAAAAVSQRAIAAAAAPVSQEITVASVFGMDEPSQPAVPPTAVLSPAAAGEPSADAALTAVPAVLPSVPGRAAADSALNQPLQTADEGRGSVKEKHSENHSSRSKSTSPKQDVLPLSSPAASASALNSAAESGEGVAGFMLGNIFNKIGALVCIIAACLFVKLIAPFVLFNPWVKLFAGYFAGGAALGTGLYLHGRGKYRNYAEVLIGIGLAVGFVMTYASCTVLEVLSIPSALAVACLLLLLVYGLAAYMKRPSMLVIGLLAGYANLSFFGTLHVDGGIGPTFVAVYLLLLSVMTLLAIYRSRMWLPVSNINLFISLFVLLIFLDSHHNGSSEQLVTFTCLSFWALYVVFDILRYRRGICAGFANTSSYLNFTFLTLFTGLIMLAWDRTSLQIGLAMLAISAGYAVLYAYYKSKDEKIGHAHLNMCLLALLAGIESADQGIANAVISVGVALGLTCWATLNKRKALLNWVLVYFTASLCPLLFGPGGKALLDLREAETFMEAMRDVWRLYILEIGIPAAGLMLAAFLVKARGSDEGLESYRLTFKLLGWTLLYILFSVEISPLFGNAVGGWFRRLVNQGSTYCILAFVYTLQWYNSGKFQNKPLLRGLAYFVYIGTVCVLGGILLACIADDGKTGFVPFFCMRFCAVVAALVTTYILYSGTRLRLFAYVALALGFGGMHVEAVSLAEHSVSYVVTACWLAYAATTVFVGLYKPNNDCTYAGIILVLLTVGRLFVVDTSDLDEIYKLLLFIAVGGALLALSFLYTKWYKNEKQNNALLQSSAGSAPLDLTAGEASRQPSADNAPFG